MPPGAHAGSALWQARDGLSRRAYLVAGAAPGQGWVALAVLHLPGLACVPGTVGAARYRRAQGSPVYLACYDITSPAVLERPEWLAVRDTEWSSRVRPLFRNVRRTMFRR